MYSFDVNIENPALEWIKDVYNISEVPSLVIDNIKYVGFMDEDNFKEFIK